MYCNGDSFDTRMPVILSRSPSGQVVSVNASNVSEGVCGFVPEFIGGGILILFYMEFVLIASSHARFVTSLWPKKGGRFQMICYFRLADEFFIGILRDSPIRIDF